jgi:hypothetical protein
MKILGIISIASILLLSCKSLNNAERSNLREAPGRGDRPEILGVNADMTWDQIKGNKKNQREIPWTDTYWPLYQMGMAARWVPNDGVLNKTPLTIYESLTQLKAVLDNNDKVAMNALSPAEKYDLMFYGPKENFPEVLKKMETIHKEVVDNPKYTDLKSGIESLHEKMQLEYEQIDELSSQFD